jgi:hypothetical protein
MEICMSNPIILEKIIDNLPVIDILNYREISWLFKECAERVLKANYRKIMNFTVYPCIPVQAMTLSLYRDTYDPFCNAPLSRLIGGYYSGMKLLFRYRELGEQEMNLCDSFMTNLYKDSIYKIRIKIKKSRDPNVTLPETPPTDDVMKYFNAMLSDENLTRYYKSPEYFKQVENQMRLAIIEREKAQKHIDQTNSPFSRNFKGDPSIYNPWETKNGNR